MVKTVKEKAPKLLALAVALLFVLIGQGVSWAVDTDGDGIEDAIDNCPNVYNPLQLDANGNSIGDVCDPAPGCGGCGVPICENQQLGTMQDTDGDGWVGGGDNCPSVYNPNQLDADHDGIGDCCDLQPGCGGCGQAACDTVCSSPAKVGALFIVHGGFSQLTQQSVWDTGVQQFSYDPNHPVYKLVIWNPAYWTMVLQQETSVMYTLKYGFEYPRIGGTDPFGGISMAQIKSMKQALNQSAPQNGFSFIYDWAYWITGDEISHYPYPRYLYNPPKAGQSSVTYCGEQETGGPWPGCDSQRYNVDGPVERLLNKGATKIIAIDLTVGGVRFSKTYDVIQMSKRALAKWNTAHGASVPLVWVNDYTSLMERSFPTAPAGWTSTRSYTSGVPPTDANVPYDNGAGNPVATDPALAAMHVTGIESALNSAIGDAATGLILLNHPIVDWNEYFDPKINDTLIVNQNIKSQLLARHPNINPDNIVGAWMGLPVLNPATGVVERTRDMRGENLGQAWLYQSSKQKPSGLWGYLYWDALEYLKNRGVKHVVVAFPQISTDSVLNLVEVHNQIAKEIGFKTWLYWGSGDTVTYPAAGNPFADYWGSWAMTDCGGTTCCFTMGGCSDGRTYPPARQTDTPTSAMDPWLAYDVCEYGGIGYDQSVSAPDPAKPVQGQYTGTWALWKAPNNDPGVGVLLAKYVLKAAKGQLGQ